MKKKFKNINKNLNFENFEFKKNIHLEKISLAINLKRVLIKNYYFRY